MAIIYNPGEIVSYCWRGPGASFHVGRIRTSIFSSKPCYYVDIANGAVERIDPEKWHVCPATHKQKLEYVGNVFD